MDDRIRLERFTLGPFQQNCYLLTGPSGRRAAVVDPGFDSEPLLDLLDERGVRLDWIVNTHGHLDHVAGNRSFKERTGARIAIHSGDAALLGQVREHGRVYGFEAEDSPPPDLLLDESEPLVLDGERFRVIHTPGHSPGGICLWRDGWALVGDTLFRGSVGRSDLPGGSHEVLVASIRRKLFCLAGHTACHPGHGPETTVAEERRSNPFVADEVCRAGGRER